METIGENRDPFLSILDKPKRWNKNLTDETKLHVSFGPWNQEYVAGAVVLYMKMRRRLELICKETPIEKAPLTSKHYQGNSLRIAVEITVHKYLPTVNVYQIINQSAMVDERKAISVDILLPFHARQPS